MLNTYYSFYLQNDWKATRRLTLNLGMRFEHEAGVTERFDRGSGGYDFNVASPKPQGADHGRKRLEVDGRDEGVNANQNRRR
jgi:hypothetical protein